MYLPTELWDKIYILSNYLMGRNKKKILSNVHKQLLYSFDYVYDWHIDKYIGYESMIIILDDDGFYEIDNDKMELIEHEILNTLCETKTLVSCIKVMSTRVQNLLAHIV